MRGSFASRSLRSACLAAFALAMSSIAQAVTLGPIQVQSYIGQRLNAQIVVGDLTPAEAQTARISLASDAIYQQKGVKKTPNQANLRFRLARSGNQAVIDVASTQAIHQPIIDFIITWQSGGQTINREYAVFLNPNPNQNADILPPPTMATPATAAQSHLNTAPNVPASAVPVPVGLAAASAQTSGWGGNAPAAAPRATTQTTSAAVSASKARTPAHYKGGHRYGPVKAGETLYSIAVATKPAHEASVSAWMHKIYDANHRAFAKRNDLGSLLSGYWLTLPIHQATAPAPQVAKAEKAEKKPAEAPIRPEVALENRTSVLPQPLAKAAAAAESATATAENSAATASTTATEPANATSADNAAESATTANENAANATTATAESDTDAAAENTASNATETAENAATGDNAESANEASAAASATSVASAVQNADSAAATAEEASAAQNAESATLTAETPVAESATATAETPAAESTSAAAEETPSTENAETSATGSAAATYATQSANAQILPAASEANSANAPAANNPAPAANNPAPAQSAPATSSSFLGMSTLQLALIAIAIILILLALLAKMRKNRAAKKNPLPILPTSDDSAAEGKTPTEANEAGSEAIEPSVSLAEEESDGANADFENQLLKDSDDTDLSAATDVPAAETEATPANMVTESATTLAAADDAATPEAEPTATEAEQDQFANASIDALFTDKQAPEAPIPSQIPKPAIVEPLDANEHYLATGTPANAGEETLSLANATNEFALEPLANATAGSAQTVSSTISEISSSTLASNTATPDNTLSLDEEVTQADEQAMDINLDLASTYIKSGVKPEKAKKWLEEVLEQGTPMQKELAKELLKKLPE